jgi:hypothetical protein
MKKQPVESKLRQPLRYPLAMKTRHLYSVRTNLPPTALSTAQGWVRHAPAIVQPCPESRQWSSTSSGDADETLLGTRTTVHLENTRE